MNDSATHAITIALRLERLDLERLDTVAPDIARQLAILDDGISDAVVAVGCRDWTPDVQTAHFAELHDQLSYITGELVDIVTNLDLATVTPLSPTVRSPLGRISGLGPIARALPELAILIDQLSVAIDAAARGHDWPDTMKSARYTELARDLAHIALHLDVLVD
jgi:hypothetical protein